MFKSGGGAGWVGGGVKDVRGAGQGHGRCGTRQPTGMVAGADTNTRHRSDVLRLPPVSAISIGTLQEDVDHCTKCTWGSSDWSNWKFPHVVPPPQYTHKTCEANLLAPTK